MLEAFKNILVPVDFTLNTEVAVTKALEVVDKEESIIHLLHVVKSSSFSVKNTLPVVEEKLNKWKESIEEYDPGVTVCCWIKKSGSVQKTIQEAARELHCDMIVIGQSSSHSWLPVLNTVLPMQLAELTGIPLLTVKPGALHNKMRTIVVPITEDITDIKLNALEILCRKGKLNVHLIAMMNEYYLPVDDAASTLLQVYQWLKAKLHCPIEYSVVSGANKAKAILQYAEKCNADILLVDPAKETRIGWYNRHISDVLSPASKVQILAV
jgi:nucleotide-binding universal stress UspA family protein